MAEKERQLQRYPSLTSVVFFSLAEVIEIRLRVAGRIFSNLLERRPKVLSGVAKKVCCCGESGGGKLRWQNEKSRAIKTRPVKRKRELEGRVGKNCYIRGKLQVAGLVAAARLGTKE